MLAVVAFVALWNQGAGGSGIPQPKAVEGHPSPNVREILEAPVLKGRKPEFVLEDSPKGRIYIYNLSIHFKKVSPQFTGLLTKTKGWESKTGKDYAGFIKRPRTGRVRRISVLVNPTKTGADLLGVPGMEWKWTSVVVWERLR